MWCSTDAGEILCQLLLVVQKGMVDFDSRDVPDFIESQFHRVVTVLPNVFP